MRLTPSLLTLTEADDDLNLVILAPTILQEIATSMMIEVMQVQRLTVGEIEDVKWNWNLAFAGSANVLPDFLRSTYPELYGENAPVTIGNVSDYLMVEFEEKPQALVVAPMVSNGDRLFRMVTQQSVVRSIVDGRTRAEAEVVPDNQWATMTALKILQSRLVPDERAGLLLQEYIRPYVSNVIQA